MIELNQRLKKFRETAGLTQQQVADVLNLDRSTYAYYEAGKTTPDIKSVSKLVKIFNVTYYDLVGEEDPTKAGLGDSEADSDNSEKMRIYELSKVEKQLIINFRVLNSKQQEEVVQSLCGTVREDSKKGRKGSEDSAE